MSPARQILEVGDVAIHYVTLGGDPGIAPIVFLHEGLGSVELWREFPRVVVERTRRPGLVYARYGNGWSTPLREPREPGYMHEEALHVLPRVIAELMPGPPVLVGHSDGASIAVIYAGAGYPVERLVLIAPHVFVEQEMIESIWEIRAGFDSSELAERMAKYHSDPKKTFYGWANIWLDPRFRSWNIEDSLPGIDCPALLIQGEDDRYGTVSQLDVIEAKTAGPCERVLLEGAGHSPHLTHGDSVAAAVSEFIDRGM